MEHEESEGAAVRLPPPLVYLAALLLGGLLQSLVRPLAIGIDFGPRLGLALLLAAPAIALVMAASRLFEETGQDRKPWKPSPELLARGIYRYTRNPMYVGMTLLQVAIGVGFANGWIVLLAPVSLAIVYFTAVRHEERYLAEKFGEPYLAYKATVRRWL